MVVPRQELIEKSLSCLSHRQPSGTAASSKAVPNCRFPKPPLREETGMSALNQRLLRKAELSTFAFEIACCRLFAVTISNDASCRKRDSDGPLRCAILGKAAARSKNKGLNMRRSGSESGMRETVAHHMISISDFGFRENGHQGDRDGESRNSPSLTEAADVTARDRSWPAVRRCASTHPPWSACRRRVRPLPRTAS